MKKTLFLAAATLLLAGQCLAQRAMDKLDRGLVAVSANNGVLVSWRVFGEDADNVRFNLYRDGALLNSAPPFCIKLHRCKRLLYPAGML